MLVPCTNGRHRTGVMLAHRSKTRPSIYVWRSMVSVVSPNAKLLLFLFFLFSGKVKMYAQKMKTKARCVMKKANITQQTKQPCSYVYSVGRDDEQNEKINIFTGKKPILVAAIPPKAVIEELTRHQLKWNSFPVDDTIREVVKEVTKWLLQFISKTIKTAIQRLRRRRRRSKRIKN